MTDRIIEIIAMVNGNIITPHPGKSIPKKCPKNTYTPPFKLRAAIPKVQTKIGSGKHLKGRYFDSYYLGIGYGLFTSGKCSCTWNKLIL